MEPSANGQPGTGFWNSEGGARELLKIALPLIVTNSVWTLEIAIDRMMLSWYHPDAVAASMPAVLLIWTPLILLQTTAAYTTTFVAQYVGAGRPHRVGPAVWQGIYFSILSGLVLFGVAPFSGAIFQMVGHSASVQEFERIYFETLCFSAMPTLVVAAATSFFMGRGQSWTVLWINSVGLIANAVLDWFWIFGRAGFPEAGIAGAGWSNAIGMAISAVLAIGLMLRRKYREEFATARGWQLDVPLFGRMMRYGLPSGFQGFFDLLAFSIFIFLVGRMGDAEMAATSIAFTINMVAIIPMLGMGQAIAVLVGQRLGENRPELAERSTWTCLKLTFVYMAIAAFLFLVTPGLFVALFQSQAALMANEAEMAKAMAAAALVPILLRFTALYTLFDSMNLIFCFALRGAGDTYFVTGASLAMVWPIMVLPTIAAWYFGWGLYWAWVFATAYIIALALVFLFRFRHGKWKSMRVIEAAPTPVSPPEIADDKTILECESHTLVS
jgi:MATE family multidrug resistance protein